MEIMFANNEPKSKKESKKKRARFSKKKPSIDSRKVRVSAYSQDQADSKIGANGTVSTLIAASI